VIAYAYLWSRQHAAGRDEAVKDRPCAVVVAEREISGRIAVTVAPITTREPADPETALEIPTAIKRHLGLDPATRSWIIAEELNRFRWPGPDLRRVPGSTPPRFDYGFLPPRLFGQLRARIVELHRRRRVGVTTRTE
jgi:PemK-like, MazF-like toxin of type II toxin-antitoxin system